MTRERRSLRWLHLFGIGKPRPEESAALEVEHHVAELTDRLVAEGMEAEEARREAERHFGDRTRYATKMQRLEEASLRGDSMGAAIEIVRQSLVSVARTARREPGFTAAVVLTLGLGIGANATMYEIIDRLLLSPPEHIDEPEQVRRLFASRVNARTGEVLPGDFSYPDYADLRTHSGMRVAAYQDDYEHTIGTGPSAFRARTYLATAELFPLLGVQPLFGRFFTAEEATVGAPPTVVLAEEFWRNAYGADPDILQRTIEIDGRIVPVIGVAPAGFTGVDLRPVDLWLPLEAWSSLDEENLRGSTNACLVNRGCRWMAAVARLRAGTTEGAAAVEATRLHQNARIEAGEPELTQPTSVMFGPLIAARGSSPSTESRVAAWLGAVSLIVMLVACANVANLLLAQTTKRRRDAAVRRALGVTRGRLVGESILDAFFLALLGGVLALALTRWGGSVIRSTLLPEVWFADSAISWPVVGYTAIASSIVGLLASIAPAIVLSRADVSDDLAIGGRSHTGTRSRLRAALTVAQATMCVVLLVGAGLFVRSLVVLRGSDLGFDADGLITADFEFTSSSPDPAFVASTYDDAIRALTELPEVASVSATSSPFGVALTMRGVRTPGADSLPGIARQVPIGANYFETAGIGIVVGRGIDDGDVAGREHVAVVNETMAAMVWPGARAVGQCLIVDGARDVCATVVGVAEDAAVAGYRERPSMAYYLPMAQLAETSPRTPAQWSVPLGLLVRVRDDARDAESSIARTLRTISPQVRWARVMPIDDTLWRQARSWTLGATMFAIFGVLALLVAAVGLYSVLAFDVAQRTREIGIRTALGAKKGRLLRGVVTQGAGLGAVGVALGLAAAYVAAPYIQDLLFETPPRDSGVFATVALALLAVSVIASLAPALRATRVDPVTALKAE
jgi:predicted permease